MPKEKDLNIKDRVRQILEENNVDPFVEAIDMLKDGELDPKDRINLIKELMKYCAPQLQKMDIDQKTTGSLKVVIETFQDGDPVQVPLAETKTLQLEDDLNKRK